MTAVPGSLLRLAGKTPSVHRCYRLTLLLAAGWASAAAGAEPLTEDQAVALALARPAFVGLGDARLAEADAGVDQARRWPNPEFEYTRERAGGSTDATDELYLLRQRFDIAGRRGLNVESARSTRAAVAAEIAARRRELVAAIRERFYDVLYRQEEIEAAAQWLRRLEAIETTVIKREQAGDLSGYARRRLTQERRVAETRLRELRAQLFRSRARLAAGLDTAETTFDGVRGELAPGALPSLDEILARLPERPDLTALRLQADAFDLARRADERGWLPEVTVGIGIKRVEQGPMDDSGLVVSASVPLPLFDRRVPQRRRAAARARQARDAYTLALAEAEGNVRGLWREIALLNETISGTQGTAMPEALALMRIAEAGYRGGELGILELLDAYRSALDARRRVLDLEQQARRSRIALDRMSAQRTP